MFRTSQPARLLARIQRLADAVERSQQPGSAVSDALRLAACSCLAQPTGQQPSGWPACSGSQRSESSARHPATHLAAISPVTGHLGTRQLATQPQYDEDEDDDGGEIFSGADFSGLRELVESGEATEADAIAWLHQNIEKYNIYAQAGEAAALAAEEWGEAKMTPQEREEILNSAEYKEAADWWLGPRPEREPPMPNLSGVGRSGWQLMGIDEEQCSPLLALDLTGGQVPNNEQNALLSDEAKSFMATMAKEFPDICTPAFLAQLFRIRQQRVMAILALKQLEAQAEEAYLKDLEAESRAARKKAAEEQAALEQAAAEAVSADATAEAAADGSAADGATADGVDPAVSEAQAAPAADASAPTEGAAADGAAAAAAADDGTAAAADGPAGDREVGDSGGDGAPKRGRGANLGDFQTEEELDEFTKSMHEMEILSEVQDIAEHDIWECVYGEGTDERHVKLLPSIPCFKEGPDGQLVHDGLTEDQLHMLAEMEAEQEEEHAVKEFQRRLAFNMGQLAPGMRRQSRITRPPTRPEGGWSLVVQPLSRRRGKDPEPAYAAAPSGRARRLTESEEENLRRKRPLPRRKQA